MGRAQTGGGGRCGAGRGQRRSRRGCCRSAGRRSRGGRGGAARCLSRRTRPSSGWWTLCVCMRVRACVNVSVCEEARGQGNNGRVQSSGTATRTKRNCCVVRSNGNSWHSWPCSTASTERVYVSNGTTASSCDNADRNSLLQKKQREEENNKKNNKRKGFADRLEGGERGVSSACLTTRQSGTPSGCRVSSTSSGRCSAANGTRSLISSSKRRLTD